MKQAGKWKHSLCIVLGLIHVSGCVMPKEGSYEPLLCFFYNTIEFYPLFDGSSLPMICLPDKFERYIKLIQKTLSIDA